MNNPSISGLDLRHFLRHPVPPEMSDEKHSILGSTVIDYFVDNVLSADHQYVELSQAKLCLFGIADESGQIPRQCLTSLAKKQDTFFKAGISVETVELKGTVIENINSIQAAANNSNVYGIIVTLPIPNEMMEILHHIPKNKDIDGINPLYNRIPSTAKGAASLVKLYCTPEDKVLVLGSSGFVGSGVVRALGAMNIPFTSFDKKQAITPTPNTTDNNTAVESNPSHIFTQDTSASTDTLEHHLSQSTIVVTAMGSGGAITAGVLQQYPKKLIVDSGFSVSSTGVVMGDVHPDVYTTPHTVSHITPVPCGCGPLEMAVLLHRFAVSAGLETVLHMTFEDILRKALQWQHNK